MVDIFPPRGMPGQTAENWARNVEDKIIALQEDTRAQGQNNAGDNRSLASQIATLSTQVKDLAGRVSYTTQGNSFQSWTTAQPDNYPFGDVLSFTLNQARMVSIQFSADIGAAAFISNTSSSAGAYIYTSMIVDGTPRFPNTYNSVAASVSGGVGRAASQGASTSATAIARLVIPLSAGAHTVQGCLRSRQVSVSGSGGGNINVDGYQLFVDVLQPLG